MAKLTDMFPSKYLKADDLQGQTVRVTIEGIMQEEVGPEREMKWILYFTGKDKGLVLNKTNAEVLASDIADDTNKWRGAAVELFAEETRFAGKRTMGTRLRVVDPQQPELPNPNDADQATVDDAFGGDEPPGGGTIPF